MKKHWILLLIIINSLILVGCKGLVRPSGTIENIEVVNDTLTFDLYIRDEDRVIQSLNVYIYADEQVVFERTIDDIKRDGSPKNISFSGLERDLEYEIRVMVASSRGRSYDGLRLAKAEFETDFWNIYPQVKILNPVVDGLTFTFDLQIDDIDRSLSDLRVNLVTNHVIVSSMTLADGLQINEKNEGLTFRDILYKTNYTIVVVGSYSGYKDYVFATYDFNTIPEPITVENVSILDKELIRAREDYFLVVEIHNPLNIEVVSLTINDREFDQFEENSTPQRLIIKMNSGLVSGQAVLAITQIEVLYMQRTIFYRLNYEYSMNVEDELEVASFYTSKRYLEPNEEFIVMIALNRQSDGIRNLTINNTVYTTDDFSTQDGVITLSLTTPNQEGIYHYHLTNINYIDEEVEFYETLSIYVGDTSVVHYIYTASDLMSINQYPINILMNDINLEGVSFVMIEEFDGYLFGNGHTISNLTGVGFIHTLSGYIDDVVLENTKIDIKLTNERRFVGSLVGVNQGVIRHSQSINHDIKNEESIKQDRSIGGLVGKNVGFVLHSSATGTISSNNKQSIVGGLIGENYNYVYYGASGGSITGAMSGGLIGFSEGFIHHSYSDVVVNGLTYAGGLIGKTHGATITHSYALVEVNGQNYVGGFIGKAHQTDVYHSYVEGMVTSHLQDEVTYTGGFIGYLDGSSVVTYSYANVRVRAIGIGAHRAGGFVGYNEGEIFYSFSTGRVSSSYMSGGLIGENAGNVFESYASGEVKINLNEHLYSFAGGLAGLNRGQINSSIAIGDVINEVECTSSTRIGGLVGVNHGLIKTSQAHGDVYSENEGIHSVVGGLVGINLGEVLQSNAGGYVYGNRSAAGGLVGINEPSGSIKNSYSRSAVTAVKDAGGLVGHNRGVIERSYASGEVTSSDENAGGLVGMNHIGAHISYSYATGSIFGRGGVGGLVGNNHYGHIEFSYATGDVSETRTSDIFTYVGGLVGINSGGITNSYATGNAYGYSAGGLIGQNNGHIQNAFSIGDVEGRGYFAGGFVGRNNGTIENAFATGHVLGINRVGGFFSYHNVFDGMIINSYQFEFQLIRKMIGDRIVIVASTEYQGLKTLELASLQDKDWYIDALGFDTSVWNLTLVNRGFYPQLYDVINQSEEQIIR